MRLHSNTPWNWLSQQQYYTCPKQLHKTGPWQEAILLSFYESFLNYTDSRKLIAYVNSSKPAPKLAPNHVMSFAQRIEEIRSILAISVSDLAAILDVTRPTIYTFMNGQEPVGDSQDKYTRIERLQLLGQKIRESELTIPCNQILRRRNQQGESLKELLVKGSVTENDLEIFVATEVEQQRERKQRAALVKNNEITQKQNNPESISTPYHLQ